MQGNQSSFGTSSCAFCFDFEASQGGASTEWRNHIVRLREYQPVAHIHSSIRTHLSALDGWKLVDRANPALVFPTDFAVVAVSSSVTDSIINALLGLAGVKDVSLDRQLRSLQSTDSDNSKHLNSGHGTVQKPSGRLQTRWSLEAPRSIEEEVHELKHAASVLQARKAAHDGAVQLTSTVHRAYKASNVTARSVLGDFTRHLMPWGELVRVNVSSFDELSSEAHKRRLLGSNKQVSSALGAPKLWSQGFKGKNIRVGADTLCFLRLYAA